MLHLYAVREADRLTSDLREASHAPHRPAQSSHVRHAHSVVTSAKRGTDACAEDLHAASGWKTSPGHSAPHEAHVLFDR